ncbi:MAG: leucine-rich repeat protein [Clostridia bacterium]|nr:leucine-rich repeat protein [Clostridia bacterium]
MKKTLAIIICICVIALSCPFAAMAANVNGVEINTTDITLYALDQWATDYISIPASHPQSFRIEVTGAKKVFYEVTSGDSVSVSADGVVTPEYTTWYWNGGYGSTWPTGAPGEVVEQNANFGKSVITVTADGNPVNVDVEVLDYADVYTSDVMDDYIEENITDSMSVEEKFEEICKFIASYDYSGYHSSAATMIVSGEGGDCWASTDAAVIMCEKLGITAWARNGNKDGGAASGHMNAIAQVGDDYYILEAGASGTAPRMYYVEKQSSLFSYRYTDGGIEVYQYNAKEPKLGTLTIPEQIDGKTVVSIGENFYYGSSLEKINKIEIPDTVKTINELAFGACEHLREVEIPDSVTYIGDGAFSSCRYLPDIDIPASVTTIDGDPFIACSSMGSIFVNDANPNYMDIEGVLFSKDGTKLICLPSGRGGFYNVPDTVTEIGESAFGYCEKLTGVTLPDGIESIPFAEFYSCSKLESIYIPDGVTSIDMGAFYTCTELKNVYIPASVTEIADLAFYLCDGITDVYYGGTQEQWSDIDVGLVNEDLTDATIHYSASPERISTVTYDSNGGNEEPKVAQKHFGQTYTISPGAPTKDGSIFSGWNDKADGSGTSYKAGDKYTANSSLTLYAQWDEVTYTVKYNGNFGACDIEPQIKKGSSALVVSTEIPFREGYNFLGWNTKKDGSGTDYASGAEYTKNEDVTLYAQWEEITYDITYDANGGSGAPAEQTKLYGRPVEISKDVPTKEGSVFAGWNTKADGSGTTYASGAEYKENKPLTLYAQWKTDITGMYERVAGEGRFDTAVEISLKGWTKSDNVVIAYGMNYADALAGVPLASALECPILLTENLSTGLEDIVTDEMERLGVRNVYILGGEYVVSKDIENSLKEKYGDENVHRVCGENRYGTSLAIAKELLEIRKEKGLGGFDAFYFCSAGGFADALAISPVAGAQLNPILYAPAYSDDGCSLRSASPETLAFVRENKTDEIGEMVIVGGIYAVSEDAECDLEEMVGPAGIRRVDAGMTGNRYDTMLVIAEVFKDVYVSDDTICVATGANFPDALAGSALASKLGCPIILVGYLDAPTNTQSSINSELCEYISEKELSDCYVFGGVYAVSDEQLELLLG